MSEQPIPLRDRLLAASSSAVATEAPPSLPAMPLEPATEPVEAPPHRRGKRQAILLVGIAVVIALAGVALNATTGGNKKAAPGAVAVGTPARTARTAVYDRFERTDGQSAGKAETGQAWAQVGPKWSTNGHELIVGVDPASKRSVAVVRGGAEGIIQVRVSKVAAGAGLVFRYKDAFDHWELVAAPKYGTWNVVRIESGVSTNVGNLGTVGTPDGATIAVRLSGDEIAISVGGVEQRTYHDSVLQGESLVGVTAVATAGQQAHFDDFLVNALAAVTPAPPSSSTTGAGG